MKIENLANAFVKVTGPEGHIVCDPWITDGIYEGSWHVFPAMKDHVSVISTSRAALITHIHADHFDPYALGLLPADAAIYLPDIYPNRHVVERKLSASLAARVVYVKTEEQFDVAGFKAEFIPPMNRYGHLIERYNDPIDLVAIDTGIILSTDEARAVLLADNFPYNLPSAKGSLERMRGCNALFFPYNACADDYPVCYDNFTLEEKQEKSLRRNLSRVQHLKKAIELLSPQLTVPYSSDFVVAGPRALEFVRVHPKQFLDKHQVAQLIEDKTKVPSRGLYEHDELTLAKDGWRLERSSRADLDFERVARQLINCPSDPSLYSPVSDQVLGDAFQVAVEHMLSRMKMPSDWKFELQNSETGSVWGVDLASRRIYTDDQISDRTVRCRTSSGYLNALLTFKSHWDNAMISYNLSWHRFPDEYDAGLYKALSYLHVPLKRT